MLVLYDACEEEQVEHVRWLQSLHTLSDTAVAMEARSRLLLLSSFLSIPLFSFLLLLCSAFLSHPQEASWQN